MSPSKLRQVLIIIENADRPLSLPQIARDLEVSQERLDGMIQYWVRKGKILQSNSLENCGTCGSSDACAYVVDFGCTYELSSDDGMIPLSEINIPCGGMQENE